MSKHKEIRFEEAIEHHLIEHGGYIKGDAKAFDPERALFPSDIISFVEKSQPAKWQAIQSFYGTKAESVLLDSLVKELASKGMLNVLRHGFKCFGKSFRLAYFTPNSKMNPDAWANYALNELTITRQVRFDPKDQTQSIDVLLAVNGLPAVTIELKNRLTNQSITDGKRQYKEDRDPTLPLFRFKERALVHFVVDTELVFMTTRLSGKKTFFLPFNRGHGFGAGNPPAPGDYRTSYLWEEVLEKDSLLDILARFMHLQVEEKQIATLQGIKKHKKETMIFPRYHQLDAVRNLIFDAKKKGSGHNYLIQHSAGSGKSNSIAWLAHRLASLHDDNDQKVFDTVIVITDRRVLDQQLQNTIYQFEHKQGVVQKIDENTQQLAKALSGGAPIIISTIQKFPFISQALETLEKKGDGITIDTVNRRFAVIVDEAHSSQSGESAMELRKILNKEGIAATIAEQMLDIEEESLSEEAKKALFQEMLKRPRQPNISFFAFTATPKFKTLAVFNEPGRNGNPPFHLYSMRQAVEEGFILDVLANYTTYKTYYGLLKSIEDDPEVPKKKAARQLARFMSLHPHNIAQKVEVIVEHFRRSTKHKIGGRAKAMVVTESRLHAVRYKLEFDNYLKRNKYNDIKSLVAFSGKVTDPDCPEKEFTEVSMNHGIKETELPEKFSTEEYQVLLVADKYQTGFDQPLLHTMYVDKRLSGIQAVQTLSRLNRIATGKEDTFVLDFANEMEDIYRAFKDYYEVSYMGEMADPHQLYDLQHRINEWQLFSEEDVNELCEIWFRNRKEPSYMDHRKMNAVLDIVVDRFAELEAEDQELVKGQIKSFKNLYVFLSQVIPFQDSDLEKNYTFLRFLQSKLPRRDDEPSFKIGDEVELQYYRLQKISEGSIDLSQGDADDLRGPTEVGTRSASEDKVQLSLLVDRLNQRFGTDFTKADELFFDQIAETAANNEKIREAAKANTLDNFSLVFEKMLEGFFVERMEGNEDIFSKLMNDPKFHEVAASYLVKAVYDRVHNLEGAE
ncbi:type I restriction endonuclease subunit R [Legionella spiritensis]|uniref:Putative type I restriction enzyme R protein n=1 Tax=Legionella spiritensis TaxID=452 RepID=A0A0W0Z8C7_LEGSP|nr:type I restriction endonuclease [Legionella spiritensis]KTD65381.1 putative type I restriction enzyme R protein [Legionella spiritensis]SNV47156.1 putative type I restriction enzyme R protein [Legionella spiritensis]